MDLRSTNDTLRKLPPEDRITFVHEAFGSRTILSTSFGEYSAVMLHMVSAVTPGVPVVSVDTGYLTAGTYRFKRDLVDQLGIQVRTYIPRRTRAEREALEGILPENMKEYDRLKELCAELKVEPVERALKELDASVWISGVMRGETAERNSFDFLMQRGDGLYKFHPLLDWTSKRCYEYAQQHGLPLNWDYMDICKVGKNECGMHLTGIDASLTSSSL